MIHLFLELVGTGLTGYILGRYRKWRANREGK
jgi:hypothetical protein